MEETAWTAELKSLLLAEADLHSLQKACENRRIPANMRPSFWQTCLGVSERRVHLEEFFDLEEQFIIRDDCMKLVNELKDDEVEKLSISGDIESVITTISKNTGVKYTHGNGWMELILPLISLHFKREEIYCCLEAILRKFIPLTFTKCQTDGNINREQPFHLLRLLILYHDPELCSFLDSKKLNPELYAGLWFRSLFASVCNIEVIQYLWDEYFLLADPFAIFFLALIILVNSREIILSMKDAECNLIVSTITRIPQALEPEDIPDLFSLVRSHYIPHTPCVRYLHPLIFQSLHSESEEINSSAAESDLAHALCLPVEVEDLVPRSEQGVKYFVIDCRTPEDYNAGHLSTAFHLDCSLMLQDKSAFEIAVQGLLMVQKQAIDAHSVAGGNHLCFIGTGKNDEDSNVFMVVASFLQRNHKFVSLSAGGYASLHELLRQKNLDYLIIDHNPSACRACITCSDAPNDLSSSSTGRKWHLARDELTTSIFDKLSTVVKSKTSEVKGKLAELVSAPNKDKYKGLSLFDENEGDDMFDDLVDEVDVEVNVDQWTKEQNALHTFKCWELKDNLRLDSFFILTEGYVYILRESKSRRGYGKVVAKRPLDMILQITSKRKLPDIITFKYGETRDPSDGGPNIIASDCLLFCESYKVTRLVKQQVIKVLDAAANESS